MYSVNFKGSEFYAFMNAAKKAPKKVTVQSLLDVFFTCEGAYIFDLVNNVHLSVKASGADKFKGAFLIKYENILKVLDGIKDAETVEAVHIDENKNALSIDGREIMTGPGFDELELVEWPEVEEKPFFKKDPSIFTDIEKAFRYASKDTTRINLNGVKYGLEGREFCATDGHRMRARPVDDSEHGAIIAPSFYNYVKSSKVDPAAGSFELSENYARFTWGGFVVESKNLEGPFPNYRVVIPQNWDIKAKFEKGSFLKAVESALKFANSRTHQVIIELNGDGAFYFKGVNVDEGITKTFKTVKNEFSDENGNNSFTIGFDGLYLKQVLEDLEGEYITANFNSPLGATTWTGDNLELCTLLMPSRITEGGDGEQAIYSKEKKGAEIIEASPIIKRTAKKATKKAVKAPEQAPAPVAPSFDPEELKKAAIEELKKELRAQVLEDLKKELKEQAKEELKTELRKETAAKIEEELKDFERISRAEVIEGLKKAMAPAVRAELEKALKPEICARIEREQAPAIIAELREQAAKKIEGEQRAREAHERAERERLEREAAEREQAAELQAEIEKAVQAAINTDPCPEPEEDPEQEQAEAPDPGVRDWRGAIADGFINLVRGGSIAAGIVAGILSAIYVI